MQIWAMGIVAKRFRKHIRSYFARGPGFKFYQEFKLYEKKKDQLQEDNKYYGW